MMEVLFRGRRVDTDEWVVGYYVKVTDFESGEEAPVIIPWDSDIYSYGEIHEFHFVDPYTVGQYCGVLDCDGRRIFEGDILRHVVTGAEVMLLDVREFGRMVRVPGRYRVVGSIWDGK